MQNETQPVEENDTQEAAETQTEAPEEGIQFDMSAVRQTAQEACSKAVEEFPWANIVGRIVEQAVRDQIFKMSAVVMEGLEEQLQPVLHEAAVLCLQALVDKAHAKAEKPKAKAPAKKKK